MPVVVRLSLVISVRHRLVLMPWIFIGCHGFTLSLVVVHWNDFDRRSGRCSCCSRLFCRRRRCCCSPRFDIRGRHVHGTNGVRTLHWFRWLGWMIRTMIPFLIDILHHGSEYCSFVPSLCHCRLISPSNLFHARFSSMRRRFCRQGQG